MRSPSYWYLPYAASGRVHEQQVASLHRVRLAEEVLRRHALEKGRGGHFVAHALWQDDKLLRGHVAAVRVGANSGVYVGDAVADADPGDAEAESFEGQPAGSRNGGCARRRFPARPRAGISASGVPSHSARAAISSPPSVAENPGICVTARPFAMTLAFLGIWIVSKMDNSARAKFSPCRVPGPTGAVGDRHRRRSSLGALRRGGVSPADPRHQNLDPSPSFYSVRSRVSGGSTWDAAR